MNTQDGSAAPESVSSAHDQVNDDASSSASSVESVSPEVLRKAVSREKRLKAELAEMQERVQEIENGKLQAEGKKDELIDKLKKSLLDKDKQLKSTVGNFAYSQVRSQLSAQAASLGCRDVEALSKLVDLDSVEVSHENFKADPDQLSMVLDEAKSKYPYLFQKAGANLGSHIPNSDVLADSAPSNDLTKLSEDELLARLNNELKQSR